MDPSNKHQIADDPCIFYEQIIPEKLIDLMVEELPKYDESYAEAHIGDRQSGALFENQRNSKVSWMYEDDWVSSMFAHYFHLANKEYWEYDLNCLDGIQITKYDVGDHYTWHSDYGTAEDNRYTRKLSATLLVTDPSEYEGGELEFIDYHNNLVVSPSIKGTMIVFDSRIPHRVRPVTKGTRISLVTWMLGPKLR
jgi:PKHD-type hydroxylase